MYRWKLQIYNSTYDVSPTYSNAAVSEEREEGFMFLRKKMPNIRLTGRDFDLVNDGSIRYKYILILEELIDGDYQEVVRGKFSKLDCKIDTDVRSLEVTPVTVDRYTTFLEGLDIEYDFLKYNPGTFDVRYVKPPILQIYVAGSPKITNIIGGRYWEQECKPITGDDFNVTLTNDYKFGSAEILKAYISGVGAGVTPDVTGEWTDTLSFNTTRNNGFQKGDYEIVMYGRRAYIGVTELSGNDIDGYNGFLSFEFSGSSLDDTDFDSVWNDGTRDMSFVGKYDEPDVGEIYVFRQHGDQGAYAPPTTGTLTHVSGANHTASNSFTTGGNNHIGGRWRWAIYDNNLGEYVFLGEIQDPLNEVPTYQKGAILSKVTKNGSSGYTLTPETQVKLLVHIVYARFLCDSLLQLAALGVTPFDYSKPDDDIVPANLNYRYAAPYDLDPNQIVVSDDNSTTVADFGVMVDDALYFAGNYFTKPSDPETLIPVNIDEWSEQSLWFHHDATTNAVQALTQTITLNHAYKLSNVISVLLSQIDSNLTHQEAEAYSDYFYGSSNPIRSSQRTIFITPKSNIIETNYNRPATRTKIKFREIIDMLANVYNAYIDIDEDNKFIIEGADFFLNGRSYSSTNPGINLSEILTTRHLGNLTDRKNIFRYEADAIPQRVMWEWMDEVSEPFEGVDMIGLDEYVTEGNVVTKNTGQFTSDIDYITVNPDSISKDGFVILEANLSGSLYTVSIWTDGGVDYQNGHLSVPYMQQAYFIYNAICNTLNINGATHDISVDGGSVMRYKIQELKIPKIPNFDTRRLITTNLGSGLVRQKTEDLSTGEINITIEHDTEL